MNKDPKAASKHIKFQFFLLTGEHKGISDVWLPLTTRVADTCTSHSTQQTLENVKIEGDETATATETDCDEIQVPASKNVNPSGSISWLTQPSELRYAMAAYWSERTSVSPCRLVRLSLLPLQFELWCETDITLISPPPQLSTSLSLLFPSCFDELQSFPLHSLFAFAASVRFSPSHSFERGLKPPHIP